MAHAAAGAPPASSCRGSTARSAHAVDELGTQTATRLRAHICCRLPMHPARALRLASLGGYRRLEHAFDRPFGAVLNPWRNLGALGFLLFWLLAVSGIYLYAVLDTSAVGAYRSIDE